MRTVYIYLYKDQKNCNKKKAQLIVWKIWCLKSHSLSCSWSFLYEIGKYACNVLVFFFNWLILIFRSNLFFFNNLFISFPCLGSFFSVVWSGYIKKIQNLKQDNLRLCSSALFSRLLWRTRWLTTLFQDATLKKWVLEELCCDGSWCFSGLWVGFDLLLQCYKVFCVAPAQWNSAIVCEAMLIIVQF